MEDANYIEPGLPDDLSIEDFSSINNNVTDSPKSQEDQMSPINMADSAPQKSSLSVNPINLDQPQRFDPINLTNSDSTITSNSGEMNQDLILSDDSQMSPININLESKTTDLFQPILSDNTPTVNTVNNNNTSSTFNNVDGFENYSNTEFSSTSPVNSITNEPKKEKEKISFFSKLGNIAQITGEALNLPSVKDISKAAAGMFGTTCQNITSRVSEISDSFSNNSINSINSDNSKTESSTDYTTSNSERVEASSNNSEVTSVSQSTMQVEQNKPSVSKVTESKNEISSSTLTTTNSPTVSNTQNQPTSNNTTSTTVSNNSQIAQPSQIESTQQPINVSVDINQLAHSIARLERVLLSGIEVTLKEI